MICRDTRRGPIQAIRVSWIKIQIGSPEKVSSMSSIAKRRRAGSLELLRGYPLAFRFQRRLAEHGELLYTTHPGSRGLLDWMDDPAHVRALVPRCGFLGVEILSRSDHGEHHALTAGENLTTAYDTPYPYH
jgi:hypothetical protein